MKVMYFIIVILSIALVIISCTKSSTNSNYTPPSDHTVSEDGIKHKPGLAQATTNCVSCHGSDLKGGTVGVSCYECHGKKW